MRQNVGILNALPHKDNSIFLSLILRTFYRALRPCRKDSLLLFHQKKLKIIILCSYVFFKKLWYGKQICYLNTYPFSNLWKNISIWKKMIVIVLIGKSFADTLLLKSDKRHSSIKNSNFF